MASSANSNPVPKLYRSVIEDVMSEVRELFLDEGVDEQVLHELKTLWENKLLQSKAVEGFHSDEQAALQASQQQQQQHIQHVQQVTQPAQTQQVILPPQQQQQAPQQQVIVRDPKLLQHMSATGMSAAATAATLALPTGVTPYQQIITQQGQILQVVRAPNGAQYIIQQSQQPIVLQQPMQSGGVQAPVIQQVLAPLQGGLPQQTGVIIQPQQIVLAQGNKVQDNAQVMQAAAMVPQPGQAAGAAPGGAAGGAATQVQQAHAAAAPQAPLQPQAQQQAQLQAQQPPMMLQVDGAGDTSSEEDEDEEEEYDDDDDEEKDKDGGEDGQVEEVTDVSSSSSACTGRGGSIPTRELQTVLSPATSTSSSSRPQGVPGPDWRCNLSNMSWFYSESLPNVRAPHPISKAEPGHPTEETHFGRLYPRSRSFGHYPKLMTIGEDWDVDRPVNREPGFLAQLPLHHDRSAQRPHHCRRRTNPPVD